MNSNNHFELDYSNAHVDTLHFNLKKKSINKQHTTVNGLFIQLSSQIELNIGIATTALDWRMKMQVIKINK